MFNYTSVRKKLRRTLRAAGFEFRRLGAGELDDIERFIKLSTCGDVDLALDVGANAGQFGVDLLSSGWSGSLVSFEPLVGAHARLCQVASGVPQWTVFKRKAIGDTAGRVKINVSQNSYSSSVLPIGSRHLESAPDSRYISTEEVEICTLASALDDLGFPKNKPYSLKIDTQGFERQVLIGLLPRIESCRVLLCEISLMSLYEGSPDFEELFGYIRNLGFRCVGLSHEFSDPNTGEMLQVNGTFVRS